MGFLSLNKDARFSNKEIMAFFLPILFEQLMVVALNVADTIMVSSLGEVTVAGVALVSRIDNFVKQFLLALAQGGSVVVSQYLGAENKKLAGVSIKNNIRIVCVFGILVMTIMVCFRPYVLNLLFGGAEPEVLAVSNSYFVITAFSYPVAALYYAGSRLFRSIGESKIPSTAAIVMMSMNLILKYIFIYKAQMGVAGAALSTLIAMAVTGIALFVMLYNHKNGIRPEGIFSFKIEWDNVRRIFNISLPNGIEQGMFQLGALLIARLVSTLGTAAIAADQISRSLTGIIHCGGTAFVAVMMTYVGRCMGAGSAKDAKFYTKHILKIDYIFTFVITAAFVCIAKPIISFYGISEEAERLAFNILLLYSVGSVTFYPTSFAVAAALRGAGDTKFVMYVAGISMLAFRVGAAYIFVHAFDLGIIGAWIAMVSDWVIRSIVFAIRVKNGKWAENKVI